MTFVFIGILIHYVIKINPCDIRDIDTGEVWVFPRAASQH